MKVIWRQSGKDWQIAEGRSYNDETQLQRFLLENPRLIPFEDVSKDLLPPAIMIPEFGLPGSGSSDVVGVDEQGGITVIECKLATNPEVKRKVIGQVLEYAAFLWQKSYGEFDEMARRRLNQPLSVAVQEALNPESKREWSEEEFTEAVTQTLDSGTFRLLIAVDSVNEELRRTIEYLAQGPSHLAIYPLEIGYFSNAQGEILVPHLHGIRPQIAPRPGTGQWTEERFFDDATKRGLPAPVVETIRALYEFCESEASRVYWGMGKQVGSYTFHYIKDSRSYSLFSVYSEGRIAINFGWLKDNVPLDLLSSFWKELQEIGRFKSMHLREDFKSWPVIKLGDALPTPEDIEKFKRVVLAFRDQIAAMEMGSLP